jgi:two-component system CheB/CheR fusion protein
VSSQNAAVETSLEVKHITFSKKNFRSMIYNLVNNALKFQSPDRKLQISITTKDLPDYTFVSVKDNGIGITESKIDSIFKMYSQVNAETEGQGLGLFLINKMINAAGGKVEVDSKPGEGAEFKLYIKK